MQQQDEKLQKIEREAALERPGYPRPIGYPPQYGYEYGYGYGDEKKLHLRDVWRLVRKHKWLVATVTVIVTTLVVIHSYRTKSIYQASATIEIGKDSTVLVKSGDLMIQSDDSDSINTKLLVLKSRPLLEEVVVNLKLDQNPAFFDAASDRPLLEAIRMIFGGGEKKPAAEPQPIGLADLAQAPAGLDRTPEESARLRPFVNLLYDNLSVTQLKDTRAVKISFTHTDPVIAAAVANGIAQYFTQYSFRSKTEKFANTSEWLERATRELKAKVEKAEQELAEYTNMHSIFSTEGKETLTTDKLSRLHDQVMRAEIDRLLKQSLYEEVKRGRMVQLPESFSDGRLNELEKRLGELQMLMAQLSVKYGPEHPKIIEVKEQIAALEEQINSSRKALEEKLRSEYERATRDEAALRAALERAKAEAAKQNQDIIQYNILKQNVETAKSLYTDFLQKTNQAKIELAQQHNNVRIIEPAQVPAAPVGPNRMRNIIMGFLLSLGFGIGLVFFLEYLDNKVRTPEDVSRYAQLPALGVIPRISSNQRSRLNKGESRRKLGRATEQLDSAGMQLVSFNSRSSVAEAYRVLRTSVLLSTAGGPPKTILITSSQPSEGKTTTTINTAISLAQLGSSVLIIDADLRRPSVHKFLKIDHEEGLSSYLSGQAELDRLIKPLPISNLWMLPCGPLPPNPAELISSRKMRELLAQLAERYDHILIDSPPLMHVTDPVILSTMVDGVILVVHGGKSTREVLRRARQELESVGAKIFGVVLNNVDLQREGYGEYYYYRYYSDYGKEQ